MDKLQEMRLTYQNLCAKLGELIWQTDVQFESNKLKISLLQKQITEIQSKYQAIMEVEGEPVDPVITIKEKDNGEGKED